MCKEGKVDTSKFGEHKTDAARLVVQDTRSIHSPAEVFSSVANSKAIKVFLSIVSRNALKDNMRHVDVWKAFPNTLLPEGLQGTLFIKLPKELGRMRS
jgi:ribosomal protein L25 (general stress protein Ctc)